MRLRVVHFVLLLLTIFYTPLKAQISFIENKGQWNQEILYKAELKSSIILVKKNKIDYILYNAHELGEATHHNHEEFLKKPNENKVLTFQSEIDTTQLVHGHLIELVYKNASANSWVTSHNHSITKFNYFVGNDRTKWASNIQAAKKLIIHQLYPGIDLVLKTRGNELKFEYKVAPNTEPSIIQFEYLGAESIKIEEGGIIINNSIEQLIDNNLYVYSKNNRGTKAVDTKYLKKGNTISFSCSRYNRNDTLIIDPQLIFSTYSGSTADNWGNTACFDEEKNLYAAGTIFPKSSGITYGSEQLSGFPTTVGAFETSFLGGHTDMTIFKMDSAGTTMLYATYIGGSGTEIPTSSITNKNGELYVLGTTSSNDFPTYQNSYKKTLNTYSKVTWSVNGTIIDTSEIFTYNFNPGDTIRAISDNIFCYDSISSFLIYQPSELRTPNIYARTTFFCSGDSVNISFENANIQANWFVNNVLTATNTSDFNYIPSDKDSIFAIITGSCDNYSNDTTNTIYLSEITTSNVTESIIGADTFCTNENYSIRIENTLFGRDSDVEWFLNDTNNLVDIGSNIIEISTESEGDFYFSRTKNNHSCLIGEYLYSDTVVVENKFSLTPSFSISEVGKEKCVNLSRISSTVNYGGSDPVINWYVNFGSNFYYFYQGDIAEYTPNNLIIAQLFSSNGCASGNPTNSNFLLIDGNNIIEENNIKNLDTTLCENNTSSYVIEKNHRIEPVGGYSFYKETDIIVFKLSKNGDSLLASSYIGGSSYDGLLDPSAILTNNYGDQLRGDIYLDANENVYVASVTASNDFPVVNAYQNTFGGGRYDGVICQLNSDLSNLNYSTYWGGSNDDNALSIKVNSKDEVVFCGGTNSTDLPTTVGSLNPSAPGNNDGYTTSLDISGNSLTASTYLGTDQFEQAYFVDLDSSDNIYILGQTTGYYPVTPGTYTNPLSGHFIHKLKPSLDSTYFSTVVGDTIPDSNSVLPNVSPTAFLVNACENIFISGWGGDASVNKGYQIGYTNNLPVTSNAFQPTTDGSDFYFMVLRANADSLIYASYFGGNGVNEHVDGGTSRFDKDGIIYQAVCAGCGNSDDFPTYPNPGAWSNTNNSDNCNNGVIKYDLANLSADFTGPSGCNPLTVTFNNLSVGGSNFVWDFGDGRDTTTFLPVDVTHSYDTTGYYTVKLYATDITTCIGIDSAVKSFMINGPKPNTRYDDTTCQNSPVQLSADQYDTSGVNSYSWSPTTYLDNANIKSPISTPNSDIEYIVTITDSLGCVQIDTVVVAITEMSPDFSTTIEGNCNGLPNILLENTSLGLPPFEVTWYMGDSTTLTGNQVNHQYSRFDTFAIKAVVSNEFCSDSVTKTINTAKVMIPNIITPNEDGVNDFFEVVNSDETGQWKLEVFDRWSKLVYKNKDYQNNWDAKGLHEGIYHYLVTSPDGKKCKGWVEVLR